MTLSHPFSHPLRLLPSALILTLALTSCAELPRLAELPARHTASGQNADRIDEATVSRVLRDTPQTAGPALQSQAARLLALGKRRGPADQLQLAVLLLARGEPGDTELAQNLLEGLQPRAADPQARNFIALLQRDAAQQLALQQTQKTVLTLQKQIDQIKSLETQLQNRGR